ncbi:MAG: hypothetical protein IK048_00495 [Clostridia bacterium]|nr:hypothetical protein [Clostridia bacterium]
MSKEDKQPKPAKESKADKQAAKDAKKERAQLQKEWEDSIIANKRVKREEKRRKIKRAMLFMLVVALIISSIVYIMLLFLDENNVRITATSSNGQRITLSMDNEIWSPYLNGKGPSNMVDISYNRIYKKEEIPTIEEVEQMLEDIESIELGKQDKDGYICFTFELRNDGTDTADILCEMTLEYDDVRNLQNCVRVMWGTTYKNTPDEREVTVYAALSDNERLAATRINRGRSVEDGFFEYIAYPVGSDNPTDENYNLADYEIRVQKEGGGGDAYMSGYRKAEPFFNDDYVFQYDVKLSGSDIMYCFVAIWLEGSDFDCVDSALGGYVKLNINFTAN